MITGVEIDVPGGGCWTLRLTLDGSQLHAEHDRSDEILSCDPREGWRLVQEIARGQESDVSLTARLSVDVYRALDIITESRRCAS